MVKKTLFEPSARKYFSAPFNTPQERRSRACRGASPKSFADFSLLVKSVYENMAKLNYILVGK